MNSIWHPNPSRKQLRDFGLTVGLALLVLGALAWWRHPDQELQTYLWSVGVLLLAGGVAIPRMLKLPYQVWMAFAYLLGVVVTNVVLAATFFFAFTAVRLVLLALRRDPLDLAWKTGAQESYWRPREVIPIDNRHLRPF